MHMPQFHLQNQFADHPLLLGRRQRAEDGKLARLDRRHIRIKVVPVLKMRPADVRERRHAQPDHVRAGPQQVAIQKLGARRILHRRVRAGDAVPGAFQSRANA